jgi:hypothetical protein
MVVVAMTFVVIGVGVVVLKWNPAAELNPFVRDIVLLMNGGVDMLVPEKREMEILGAAVEVGNPDHGTIDPSATVGSAVFEW